MIETSANGRVNLIGEHTDYNGGFVLPTAIPQKTTVQLKTRSDDMVFVSTESRFADEELKMSFRIGEEKPCHRWIDYIQGITSLLRKDGYNLSGFEAHITSDVPAGSGLSSSAALEIAILKALKQSFSLDMTVEQMALLGQRVENDFVGAKVGIMDQMACALAEFGEALYLDTRTLTYERIDLPFEAMDLIVINSGIKHRHSDGGYNQRRSECEAACATLGVAQLRDIEIEDLSLLNILPDIQKRRARHVITENARVQSAVEALKRKDLEELGALFYQSHASMRDDYEVSVTEIDLLVDLCRAESAVFGARLTGGGFGGSIVALAKKNHGREIAENIVQAYHQKVAARAVTLIS